MPFDVGTFPATIAPVRQDNETQAILRRAKALIGRHGWNRERRQDKEGRLCMVGAIALARGAINYNVQPNDPEIKALRQVTGARLIALWNDHPRRRQADVYAAFDRAIEIAGETNAV